MSTDFLWGFEYDDLVLNHPILRVQASHKQLGQVAYVLPGARHSRHDHMGFTKLVVSRIFKSLEERGDNPGRRNDIVQYAKIHDIDHTTFSHAIEYVVKALTGVSAKQRFLQLLDSDIKDEKGRTLKDVLEETGACPENIRRMRLGEDKAGKIASDKSIGADKIAYTVMDAERCGFYMPPPAWERMLPDLTFVDDYGIDVKKRHKKLDYNEGERQASRKLDSGVNIACAMQYLYFKMYTEVYLSSESIAYQRHLQKAVELAVRGGIISAEELWEIGDDTLLDKINNGNQISDNPLIQKAKETLSGFMARDPYVPVVAFKIAGLKKESVEGQKVIKIDNRYKEDFVTTFENPLRLTELEDIITNDMKGVPVLCCLIPDPEKVKPSDIPLYEGAKKIAMLSKESEAHYRNLEEMADDHFAIRLRVPPSEKEVVSRKIDKLCESFFEHSKKFIERDKKQPELAAQKSA